jgi:hypothetical protein
MNIDEIIASVEQIDIEGAEQQVARMQSSEISVLGPMNMLAFDA